MELWFLYALIASFSIGINGYLVKLMADRKIEGAIITFLQGLIYFLLGGIHNAIMGYSWFDQENMIIILFSISIASIIFLNLRIRVFALRYLSSSEYYIGYRILITIGLVVIGLILFHEKIIFSQFLGLILGSMAIIFLFEEDVGLRHSRNWGKAFMLLVLSVVAGIGIQIIGKIQGISSLPISTMLFYQGATMLCISGIFDRNSIRYFLQGKRDDIISVLFLLIPASVFVYIAAIYNLLAYGAGGNVSIVTKILAYSLFIPIILSILFAREKVGYKKIIAFFLTIISLYFMV